MDASRDAVKAGLFVVVGLALAAAVIAVLSDLDRLARSPRTVQVDFSLAEGIAGLRRGATVTVGGEPAGRVTGIGDVRKDGRIVAKRVRFTLPRRYELTRNAVVELAQPLLGSGAKLNVASLGTGKAYEPGTALEGTHAGLAVAEQALRQAGIGPEEKKAIGAIVRDVRKVAATLRARTPELAKRLDGLLADAEALAADGKAVAARFRKASDRWKKRIDRVTADAREAVAGVRALVEEKGPSVRGAIDDTRAVTKRAREKMAPKLETILARTKKATDDLRAALADAKGVIAGKRPALERTVDNVATTSEQIKLAAVEIRHAPWRLLYEPDQRELKSQNIYDAARSFALGASALRNAAEQLRALETQARGDDRIPKVREHLRDLFERFRDAETRFWNALGEPPQREK